MTDRYGSDVLARNPHAPKRARSTEHPVEMGLVVEDAQTGWVGAVVRVEGGRVELEDRRGKIRAFPMGPGFLIDGKPVILTAPKRQAAPARTASGSVAVPGAKARVARASRIYVEGRHDAELVEQVWGADLRIEGVVVDTSAVSTTWPTSSRSSPRNRAGAWACSSTIWSRVRRRRGSPTPCAAGPVVNTHSWWGTPSSTSGRPSNRPASA